MAVRALAAFVAAATFLGSGAYVLVHPKNPAAPLQPPAASEVARPSTQPSTTPRGSARPSTSTVPPKITLQPGVRATELPGITYTHVS